MVFRGMCEISYPQHLTISLEEIKISEKYIKEKIGKVIENRIDLSIFKIIDETLKKELPPILLSEKQKKDIRARIYI